MGEHKLKKQKPNLTVAEEPELPKICCKNCQFSIIEGVQVAINAARKPDERIVICRRYPPAWRGPESGMGWPVMLFHNWCGEFKEREEAPAE